MKTSTLIAGVVAVIIVLGGVYWWIGHSTIPQGTSSETPTTTTQSPVVSVEGGRCGGNMTNAPVCSAGTHCAPEPGSNLPFGDVGGLCIKDNPAQYVEGNLLLGQDSTTTLGAYLIAYNGMTLYRYTKDKVASSTCYGQCAVNWPPYVIASTSALSNIQAGIKGKVSAITRADGTLQVTYKDQPLYFWINDKVSGDTTGQNVGKVWFVVKP